MIDLEKHYITTFPSFRLNFKAMQEPPPKRAISDPRLLKFMALCIPLPHTWVWGRVTHGIQQE